MKKEVGRFYRYDFPRGQYWIMKIEGFNNNKGTVSGKYWVSADKNIYTSPSLASIDIKSNERLATEEEILEAFGPQNYYTI